MSKKRRQGGVQTNPEPAQPETKKLKPITINQSKYFKAVEKSTITIVTGPAGTGKTYMAAGMAAESLNQGLCDKIILVRPLVVCGTKDLGAMPGELDQKVGPYMRPLVEAFEDFFRPIELSNLVRTKKIKLEPLETLRGSTLKNAFVIMDEAQNCEYTQLHMLLTRIGKDSKYIITGDVKQTDRRQYGPNPLAEVVRRFSPGLHKDISIVELTKDDIVRHPLIGWMDERLSGDGSIRRETAKQEKPEWIGEDCPACDAEFWYLPVTEKGHPVEQVACWRCRQTIEIPEDDDQPCWVATCVTQGCIESKKSPPEE